MKEIIIKINRSENNNIIECENCVDNGKYCQCVVFSGNTKYINKFHAIS